MKVAIVGVCASGKTTVAELLKSHGFDAYVVGQEHSAIADLWSKRSPDALVYLDVSLSTIRARRGPNWPEWIYNLQLERLAEARKQATVRIRNDSPGIEQLYARLIDGLSDQDRQSEPSS